VQKYISYHRYSAYSQYQALKSKKEAKGYTEGPAGIPYQGTTFKNQDVHSGITPMLLEAIDASKAKELLTDTNWVMQQKYDGIRLLVHADAAEIQGINRRGMFVGLPQTIVDQVKKLGLGLHVLDGELVDGNYYMFDALTLVGQDLRAKFYTERYQALATRLEQAGAADLCPNLILSPLADTYEDKAAMLQAMVAKNAEGVVFKDKTATYQEGVRSSNYLKYKFWASATVRVIQINQQRSIQVEVLDGKRWIDVGNCAVPLNYPMPKAGDLVEVKYLYAYRKGSLYQPQYKGLRPDCTIADATINQLKYKEGT
jgi:bifunctional non-homologous end joining protein LigD